MDLHIYPKLTKSYILERISQEEIMTFYLGVPVVPDLLIKCPPLIRATDNTPSFSFYYNSEGRLRGRDFGKSGFWGDCFDVVAKAINVDSGSKKGFQLIIHTIAKDFRIHKYKDSKEVAKYDTITKEFFSKKKAKIKTVLKVIPRSFNYHDLDYWKQFNVSEVLLRAGKVFAAEEIYISKNNLPYKLIYTYKTKDPAYCYHGGVTKRSNDWKIYLPYRQKGEMKFLSNSSFLQGKHLITCDRVGGIVKAYKDSLAFRSFGIQTVAPSNEGVLISKDDFFFMNSSFDFLFSCMDFDPKGIKMAIQLRNTYGIQPIMFNKSFDVKDFAEYVQKYGQIQTKKLLNSLFEEYKDELYKVDKYYYNKLKHTRNEKYHY